MGYIGRRMSTNAADAYKRGLLPRSKFTKKILKENGWEYSYTFFNWLCKQNYIMALEYHHTTPMVKLTPFYSPKTISYIVQKYDLESLYDLYLNKCTVRDIIEKKGIKRVRIVVSRNLMHTKSDVYLDCIQYNDHFWWSKQRCFKVRSEGVALIKEYHIDDFREWHNPNKRKIERQILIRKRFYMKP